jgi:WD40 repeat protein
VVSLGATPCPDDDDLSAFVERRLEDKAAGVVETHLDACEACRSVLAAFARGIAPLESVAGHRDDLDWRDPDRYKLVDVHGVGGQGRVWRAFDKYLGREVAYKELRPTTDPERAERSATRFLREGRVTAQLMHPSIVPVYELGRRADGTPYCTMQLVNGKTLKRAIASCQSPQERELLLPKFAALCQAVAYAHSRGVVHRDLKPDNIILGEFGETIVVDWGLAKTRGADDLDVMRADPAGKPAADVTVAGTTVGTPAYMSPERARGEPDSSDEASDVWSLGAVMFEILTGRPPFIGRDATEVLAQLRNEHAPPIREVEPRITAELSAIVDKALSADRTSRYTNAASLAREVEAYLAGQRVAAHDYSTWELLKRFTARHRVPIAIAALGACALMVVAIAAYERVVAQRRRAEAAELQALAEQHRVTRERDQARANLADALESKAKAASAVHDDALADVYAAASLVYGERPVARGIAIAAAAQPTYPVRWRSRHGAGCSRLAYSPNGRLLACADANAGTVVWNVATGAVDSVLKDHDGEIWALAFSPDGRYLATGGHDQRVVLWDIATHALIARGVGHRGPITDLAFSADGRSLASASDDGSVRLWEATTLAARGELVAGGSLTAVDVSADGALVAAGADTGAVHVWHATGAPVATITATHEVDFVRFRDGGHTLLVGAGSAVLLSNVSDGTLIATLSGLTGHLSRGALADASSLIAGSDDGSVRWLDLSTKRQRTLIEQGGAPVMALAATPDGTMVAIGTVAGVEFRDVRTGALRAQIVGHDGPVSGLAFAPGGRELASAGGDGVLAWWDPQSGARTATVAQNDTGWHAVAYGAGAREVAVAGADGGIRIIDRQSGHVRVTLTGHQLETRGIAYSPDGLLLASASLDQTLRLWDVASGREIRRLASTDLQAVAFSPDGTLVVSAGLPDCSVWRVSSGAKVAEHRRHDGMVRAVLFAGDSETVFSAGQDGTIRRWRVHGTSDEIVLHAAAPVSALALSPDGTTLISGDVNGRVILWDATSGIERGRPGMLLSGIATLAVSGDGSLLAAGDEDGTITVWQLAVNGWPRELAGHTAPVTSVAFSPDGSMLASAGPDGTRLWNATTAAPISLLPAVDDRSTASTAFSPDGKRIATSGSDRIQLWDWPSLVSAGIIETHQTQVRDIQFSPDSTRLATAGNDGTVRLWDATTRSLVRTLTGTGQWVLGVAYSPDGNRIVFGGADTIGRIADPSTGKEVGRLGFHQYAIRSAAWSRDRGTIATATGADHVYLWNPDSGASKGQLDGSPQAALTSVALAPRGPLVAAGAGDGRVYVWTLPDRNLRAIFGSIGTQVLEVAFSPSGSMIASASDTKVRLWELGELMTPGADLLERAERRHGLRLLGSEVVRDKNLVDSRIEPWPSHSGAP